MILRPYQSECEAAIGVRLERHRSTLAVLATGLGKTVIFAHRINNRLPHGEKAMVIAHREELIDQAAEKIYKITGIHPQIEKAERQANDNAEIIVASVQTLMSKRGHMRRLHRFTPRGRTLYIDEAHHVPAKSYTMVADYFLGAGSRVVGFTATPDRLDKLALGSVFDTVAYRYGICEAVQDGWLVPISQRQIYVNSLDFRDIGKVGSDFNQGELSRLMQQEKNLHSITVPTLEMTESGERGIIFCASVAQATRLSEIINRYRQGAAFVVSDKTKPTERRSLMRMFKQGESQFLVNVGIATEGFDDPGVEFIIMARPTMSRALYEQMIGRGTRPVDGLLCSSTGDAEYRRDQIASSHKPRLTVLDFVGISGKHKLVTSLDILGGRHPSEVVETAKKLARSEATKSTEELLQLAQEIMDREQDRRISEEKARAVREKILARAKYSSKSVDPFDILDLTPKKQNPRFVKPLSQKQIDVVKRAGIDTSRMNMAELRQIFFEIIRRLKNKLCTYRQARLLKMYGYNAEVSMNEANRIIGSMRHASASGDQLPGIRHADGTTPSKSPVRTRRQPEDLFT